TDVSNAFVDSTRLQAQESSQQQQQALQAKIASVTRQIGHTRSAEELDSLRNARSQLQAQLANVIANGIQQEQSVRVPAPATAAAAGALRSWTRPCARGRLQAASGTRTRSGSRTYSSRRQRSTTR